MTSSASTQIMDRQKRNRYKGQEVPEGEFLGLCAVATLNHEKCFKWSKDRGLDVFDVQELSKVRLSPRFTFGFHCLS